ncbi:phosphorylcholine transferase [Campylobacter pinnipediorum subsp. pinnipediorum]|uniref:LicD family protein n=1 Tax=Campylobacter pinnipediorum TaxID=1965231 RepID=UPI00084DB4E4|nr:LicD family protein [Campylobacter pinnipediorum]AQW81939.1 phosphorylcholine transferase [Campylobacter pinnipediorum subsp. pinnipediorum]AQW85132.1 phosphorylcholine transferase [Campylobacter pinnipediorum subsp. pinnipediorum]
MQYITVEQAKKVMLEMMDYIHDICIKNDIKYSLAYGTLIGAVRHKGFIPWDDDFDIFLTRENYEKLLKLLEKSEDYFIIDYNKDDDYYLYFAKLCSKKYKGEQIDKTIPIIKNFGVFIDIFPLDYRDEENPKMQLSKIKNYKRQLLLSSFLNYNKTGKKHTTYLKAVTNFPRFLYHKFIIKRCNIIQKLYEEETKYNSKKTKFIGVCTGDMREIYDSEDFEEYTYCDFENRKYMIIKHFDPVLKITYGDYNKLPPEEERVNSHAYYRYYINKQQS